MFQRPIIKIYARSRDNGVSNFCNVRGGSSQAGVKCTAEVPSDFPNDNDNDVEKLVARITNGDSVVRAATKIQEVWLLRGEEIFLLL